MLHLVGVQRHDVPVGDVGAVELRLAKLVFVAAVVGIVVSRRRVDLVLESSPCRIERVLEVLKLPVLVLIVSERQYRIDRRIVDDEIRGLLAIDTVGFADVSRRRDGDSRASGGR